MKNFFEFKTLVLILSFFISSNIFAAVPVSMPTPCENDPWGECNENGGNQGHGDGNPATPIDDYLPLLVITAVTIAGVVSYKQSQLIKK